MNDLAISISSLGKMYKLYRHPADKVLDTFGINRWLFWRKNNHQAFWALRDLNLAIPHGERVGIIGRNGAGKSTLLKIISGNITPTEGTIKVTGRVQALLELGTGFHPEFTGRQNIGVFLSYQGMSSSQIREKEEEIVDFAELEEFIDQPIKTYSAGMYARLAFSTATVVEPELLIIDEILGAGDAYFAGKCLERMRRLTEESGATVLFVSHDLGSVQQVCERVIWIDRGRIVADGDPLKITKAYYASILQQEEIRLKARNARLTRRQFGEIVAEETALHVHELLGRLVIPGEKAPRLEHPVRALTLTGGNDFRLDLHPGTPMDNDVTQPAHILADRKYMDWGEPRIHEGSRIRCFEDTGGSYLHAPFVFRIPSDTWTAGRLHLAIEHAACHGEDVAVEVFDGKTYERIGFLNSHGDDWRTDEFEIMSGAESQQPLVSDGPTEESSPTGEVEDAVTATTDVFNDRMDTPEATFIEITPITASGMSKNIFACGEPFGFRISTEIRTPIKTCSVIAVIYDSRGNRVSLYVHKFEQPPKPGLTSWTLLADKPILRHGEYFATFELLPHYDPLATEKMPFFCHWDRCVSFRIDENYVGHVPLGIVDIPFVLQESRERVIGD